MEAVGILGLGLMGGSLGLALKRAGNVRVIGWARRAATRELAIRRGCLDVVAETPEEVAAQADITVLCVPVGAMPDLVQKCRSRFQPGAIVTDVGSTKWQLCQSLPLLLKDTGAVYCGSHPIAGSEQQGLEAAQPDLYRNAIVVVTPDGAPEPSVQRVVALWESVGAKVRMLSAREHDQILARTSHLPHLVAALLSTTVGRDGAAEQLGEFCGTGFRDATRIAEGSPKVWRDIVSSNREAITRELKAFNVLLSELLQLIESDDLNALEAWLDRARSLRQRLARREGPAEEKLP